MDEIDVKIIELLVKNADASVTEIGAEVKLSVPATNKRIRKLQQEGVISRFTILVDKEKAKKPIVAFILVVLQSDAAVGGLLDYVEKDADVLECYAVTGEYDYLIKVCAADVQALERKILCLKRRKGVAKSHTLLSLMEHKFEAGVIPEIPESGKKRK